MNAQLLQEKLSPDRRMLLIDASNSLGRVERFCFEALTPLERRESSLGVWGGLNQGNKPATIPADLKYAGGAHLCSTFLALGMHSKPPQTLPSRTRT